MENIKIPDISSLAKKTNYDTNISELEKKLIDRNHDKYITTPEFNTRAASVFNVRLAQANLRTKTDFDPKLSSLNRKITSNKLKHLLVENELKKLKIFDSSYIIGKSHFEEDGTPNYLVFQSINRHFKVIANAKYISSWKFKGLSHESIKLPATSDNSLSPLIDYLSDKIRLIFNGSCIKQGKLGYTHRKTINIYIVYKLTASSSNNDDPTVRNSLFRAVRLSKNADIDKYGYSGCRVDLIKEEVFHFQVVDLVDLEKFQNKD